MLFLGIVMGEGKVEIEEDKVKGVLKWPMPQCVRDVRKFLGLANYYRRFVKNFAKVALPMNQLTRKEVLATPELDKEFRVEADASNFETGEVLLVKYDDDLW